MATRAVFQGRATAEILADIEAARVALRLAPQIDVSTRHPLELPLIVRDMRRAVPFPELVEAAARDGLAYIAGPFSGPDQRHKYTVAGTPDIVLAWISHWAPAQGLVDLYGDPARGFAGGYDDSDTREEVGERLRELAEKYRGVGR